MFADRPTNLIRIAWFLCVVIKSELISAITRHPLVVVMLLDGFRPDYIRPDTTPNLARLRQVSAAPPYMRPVFPTITFVNLFSIATGLYSESHGVLNNQMFDSSNNTIFDTYEQFHYDESVVPIWIKNENNGVGRHSGIMMWIGSSYSYQGKKPTYTEKYNESISSSSRIDKIISWIKDDKKPANLVFAYFQEPDHTGHINGIKSQETGKQISQADSTIKYMLDKIKEEKLENKLNLIILSDHGMETITYDKIIFLENYVSNTTFKIIKSGPNAFIIPNSGKYDEIYKNLTKGATVSGKFNVYKKEEIPERWHMKHTSRMNGIIFLLTKPGYTFWVDYFKQLLNETTKDNFRAGMHGYDNEDPSMRALFMASGPAFKKNFTAQPFENVDLYPLISHILDLKEIKNGMKPNGTMTGVKQLLANNN